MRRQQLSETQIAALFDPTTDPRELVRHYTLSETDIAIIRRCRGDHSRLGYALMLCYLRHPGRPLRIGERPPAALVSFVAGPDRCSARNHRRLSQLRAEPSASCRRTAKPAPASPLRQASCRRIGHLGLSALLGHGNTTSWTNQERASVT